MRPDIDLQQIEKDERDEERKELHANIAYEDLKLNVKRDKREQKLYWIAVISLGVSIGSLIVAGGSLWIAGLALWFSFFR